MLRLVDKRLSRREWRALPYVGADHGGWSRLAAAVLLRGYLERDVAFVMSEWACGLARLVELDEWPPAQWFSRQELAERAAVQVIDDTAPGRLQVRSRNPADRGRAWAAWRDPIDG